MQGAAAVPNQQLAAAADEAPPPPPPPPPPDADPRQPLPPLSAEHVQAMRNIKHVMDNAIGAPRGGMVTAVTNSRTMRTAKKNILDEYKGVHYARGGGLMFDADALGRLAPMTVKMIAFINATGVINMVPHEYASTNPTRVQAFRALQNIVYIATGVDQFDYDALTPDKYVAMGAYLARLHAAM